MCIERGKEIKPRSKSSSGFGWKEFSFNNGKIYGELYECSILRKIGVWYRSKSGPGFHIFTSLKSAKIWGRGEERISVLAKVEYKEAHTKGVQRYLFTVLNPAVRGQNLPTIIANKMRIIGLYHIDSGKPITQKEPRAIRKRRA